MPAMVSASPGPMAAASASLMRASSSISMSVMWSAAAATDHITDMEIDELARINDALAAAIGPGDAETIAGIEFAFHRVFNHASGRIKLAWFLLNAARYMPVRVYAVDPQWGAAAVANHQQLIAALRRRDAAAVIEHTVWQFTDAANRLTEMLDRSGIFGSAGPNRQGA